MSKISFLSALVFLTGFSVFAQSVPLAVSQAVSSSAADPALPMAHMILTLQPSATQQAALAQLIAQQSDPKSPNYHKFLTPAQFAAQFGASSADINKTTAWLASQGFHVEQVMPNHLSVVFSGNAAQVRSAFGTEIRQYLVNGQMHHANATPVQMPPALSAIGASLVKLHDFHSKPNSLSATAVHPQDTIGSAHYLAPADYATIYDLSPLYSASINGTGQTIAVVGRSDVLLTDVAAFQTEFGLAANAPTIIQAGYTDPGFTGDGDSVEATLDVEWAGALAPGATVKLVVAASTNTTDGVDLAAEYAVNNNVASVLSVSFGSCEAETNNQFYNNLWQQAVAQGMTVFVSAGDSGAAGCQEASATNGTVRAVNGLCSSPYSTCVGGTEFNEGTNPGQYWLSGNNAVMGSAISYIPEKVWNESGLVVGGSALYAGGGGISTIFAKPAWQAGVGVLTLNQRLVPDVSLTAAAHDGYLVIYDGSLDTVSGTSASSPSMAGIMALVNQQNGAQGFANPNFYALAAQQAQGGPAFFHDIVIGNNAVPGLSGYVAGIGYDEASGLGSVDAAILVNQWNSAVNTFTLTSSGSTTVSPAQNGLATITASASGTFSSDLALSLSPLPTGVTATLSSARIPGGSGAIQIVFGVAKSALSGTYPVTVIATGGGLTKTTTFDLIVSVPTTCTLASLPASISMVQGQGSSANITCSNAQGAFPTSLTMTVMGMASGMTATFSPATLIPGAGLTKLTVTTTTAVAAGTYPLTVTASLPTQSPSFSQTIIIPVTVNTPNTFTLTPSVATLSIAQGSFTSFTVTSAPSGSFNAAIALSLSGMPPGTTGSLSTHSVAAPGNGVTTVALQSAITTPPGTYSVLITGVSVGLICTLPVKLTITAAPTFVFTASQNTLTIHQTSAASVTLTVGTLLNGFNSAVTLAATGLPTGVTATFTPASLTAPGSGTTVLSLAASSTATTGIATISLTATGGTLVRTIPLQITVTGAPTFSLATSLPSANIAAGTTFTDTITATGMYGYNSSIVLSAGTLPAGLVVSFKATTISGFNGTTTVTIQSSPTITPGTYSIVITGTDAVNSITKTTTISLLIGTVTTSLSPTSVSLVRGGSATTTVTIVATDYPGSVLLYLTGMPTGLNYTLSSTTITGSGTSTLSIGATPAMIPGVYMVYLHTTIGSLYTLTPLTVVVN